MKEEFLHYLWRFQKFQKRDLQTTSGEAIKILNQGTYNEHQGPDFLAAQLIIGNQRWAGNIELHVTSSEWMAHGHQDDPNYDNVILHVVWEHDREIFRKDKTQIPTLILENRVDLALTQKYHDFFSRKEFFIPCEQHFKEVPSLTFNNWLNRLFVERLEEKTTRIVQELEATQNNWEAVFFRMLLRNFGLKLNGESFFSIAKSVPFDKFQKCRYNLLKFEALLFGQAGMLEKELPDSYYELLQDSYTYSKHFFELDQFGVVPPKFFRLRPPNFPTIRLAQFAALWTEREHLFSEVITTNTKEEFYKLFHVAASEYWDLHYNFEVASAKRKKSLTKGFIDLLLINTVIPIKFAYAKYQGEDISENLEALALSLSGEKNKIITKFRAIREMDDSAMYTQALLQLKQQYCDNRKCLHCAVGNFALK